MTKKMMVKVFTPLGEFSSEFAPASEMGIKNLHDRLTCEGEIIAIDLERGNSKTYIPGELLKQSVVMTFIKEEE
jgi:hypothetical protein